MLAHSYSLYCHQSLTLSVSWTTELVKSAMISARQRLHIIWADHPKSILIKNDSFYLNNMRINVCFLSPPLHLLLLCGFDCIYSLKSRISDNLYDSTSHRSCHFFFDFINMSKFLIEKYYKQMKLKMLKHISFSVSRKYSLKGHASWIKGIMTSVPFLFLFGLRWRILNQLVKAVIKVLEFHEKKNNECPESIVKNSVGNGLTFDLVTMLEASLTTAKFPLPIVFSNS